VAVNLGEHTITIVRPPTPGPNGDPLPGTGTSTDVGGCSVQPRTSTETTDGRDTIITGLIAYIPAGADIQPTDTIRFKGASYAVDGDPGYWDDLAAAPDHVEVLLRRVSG
jgi:hypothetical protein